MADESSVSDDVQIALAASHRARAWEYRMRAVKELAIAGFVVLCGAVIYALVTDLWHHLPK